MRFTKVCSNSCTKTISVVKTQDSRSLLSCTVLQHNYILIQFSPHEKMEYKDKKTNEKFKIKNTIKDKLRKMPIINYNKRSIGLYSIRQPVHKKCAQDYIFFHYWLYILKSIDVYYFTMWQIRTNLYDLHHRFKYNLLS